MILLAIYFAEAVDAVVTPPASIAAWVSVLTGSGGALAVLGLWVKTLLAEKRDMVASHRQKDEDLLKITREAVTCITASLSQQKLDESFRQRLEDLLTEIRERLPD